MNLFDFFRKWLKKTFQGKKQNTRFIEERFTKSDSKEIKPQEPTPKEPEQNEKLIIDTEAAKEFNKVVEDKNSLLIPKDIFQSFKIDFNAYKPFFPNWGHEDPNVSIISDGRIQKEFINRLYDEFALRYGDLTTNLGYGLIYSIVMNAIEKEDRSVSSALREAIVRSGDPLLCVAVVKDYCLRKSLHFNKYEKITQDILKRREAYYTSKTETNKANNSIDLSSLPLEVDEIQTLDKSQWLFNGTIVTIEPLYLIVKLPTLKDSQLVREFNKNRHFKLNQNVVVQWEGEKNFRILDFK